MAAPPKDYLKATLEAMRFQALRRVEEVSGKSCAEVSQLRIDVQQLGHRHRQQLLHYGTMSKPTDHKEQSARNSVRKELREVAQAVQPKMQRLFDASSEPTASLHAARAEQLNGIDGMVDMLMAFRRETVEIFDEYATKVNVDCLAAEAGLKSLAPAIENIDKFMQCFAQEVQCEEVEADRLHQELVDKLEKEEILFVSANDSPSRSPRFAKVQEDLAACKRLTAEQAYSTASNTSLMQSWDSILKAMPSKKQPEPEAPRDGFWRRLGYGSRTAPCSD